MSGKTPSETVDLLMKAISAGDIEGALDLYEPQAVFMAEPGKPVSGKEVLRQVLQGFMALKPDLKSEKSKTVLAGDLAFYASQWKLEGKGPDGKPVSMGGKSADILRRQADGTWKIVVDNAWGTEILS